MASVLLNQLALSNLKSAIQLAFPSCKSSHLTESMAAALASKPMQHLKELGNSNLPLTYILRL